MDPKINGAMIPGGGALSYLGDARHALYVRRMLIERGLSRSADLNRAALAYVTAEKQAELYKKIEDELTDFERDVFKRAANSTHLNKPKHARGADYRCATGFEAVIGMLTWLGEEERLEYLLDKAHKESTAPCGENIGE